MKRTLLALSLFACVSMTQAEIIESNVSIQMKLYTRADDVLKPPFTQQNFTVTAFKTSTFIDRISKKEARDFTPKARLIHRVTITAKSSKGDFFIVEKGKADLKLSQHVLLDSEIHLTTPNASEVSKSKFETLSNLGNYKFFSSGEGLLATDGGAPELLIHGPLNRFVRVFESKEHPSRLMQLTHGSITGIGTYDFSEVTVDKDIGIAQGSIKLSPPKILPGPATQP